VPGVAEHRRLRLPLFTSLRGHDAGWLRGDVVAGLTVWAVLVPEALAHTAALAITTGLLALAAGLLRLGFLASFISEPVLKGFIIGLA
jgi:MFS superfamily sulfate permease-like transporter